MVATELEFFLFETLFDETRKEGFRNFAPIFGYMTQRARAHLSMFRDRYRLDCGGHPAIAGIARYILCRALTNLAKTPSLRTD